jgi:hypothetical protein
MLNVYHLLGEVAVIVESSKPKSYSGSRAGSGRHEVAGV